MLRLLLCALVALSACAGEARPTVRVHAASSLSDAFDALAVAFEAAEGVRVQLTFAGSQTLRYQIEQGAPTDVVACADARHMDALAQAGRIGPPIVFARNSLAVIVPLTNPAAILSFVDLRRAERLVIGAPAVPIGGAARALIDHGAATFGDRWGAQVRAAIVSEEANVRLVRAKVALGEADAAIVYRTDARSDQVIAVPIPDHPVLRTEYPIAAVRGGHEERAERWIAFVTSDAGRGILDAHGFDPP